MSGAFKTDSRELSGPLFLVGAPLSPLSGSSLDCQQVLVYLPSADPRPRPQHQRHQLPEPPGVKCRYISSGHCCLRLPRDGCKRFSRVDLGQPEFGCHLGSYREAFLSWQESLFLINYSKKSGNEDKTSGSS